MGLRPWQPGGIAVVALAAGARAPVAFGVFRPNETANGHTTSCGAMTWRSTTTVRKLMFDATPRLVGGESVVDVNGERLADDVAQWRCAIAGDLSTFAIVIRWSDPRTVTAFDGASGKVLGLWRVDSPVASLSISPGADLVALVSSDNGLSVLAVHSPAPPRVVAREPPVLP